MKFHHINQQKKVLWYQYALIVSLLSSLLVSNLGCEKLVEVNSLTDRLLATQVFESDATANSAINGIYRGNKGLITFISIYNSLSSDDLRNYSTVQVYDEYRDNTLQPTSTLPWSLFYSVIYSCNAAIEGLQGSKGVSEKAGKYYTGEAKFNRALCYFHLVNLFGDVPLILTTNVKISSTLSRTASAEVYNQIITDLKEAQAALGNDYSFTGGERTRANKWAATALLARVYLYQKDWINAELQANAVINSGYYTLLNNPVGIFQKNNSEAILQYANNATENNSIATSFIFTTTPQMICTSYLLSAFEVGDLRKSTWISSKVFSGTTYYFPFKFTSTSVAPSEYYTMMRLAELYMVRAEAKAMQDKFSEAIQDINLIRQKHGGLNTPLPAPISQNACINLIMKERQVDLFTEGMHRWFDLKRTGRLEAVMIAEKPLTWKSTASLYPIPLTDIQRNSNLTQNNGYQ